jgi:deoxyribodipyrimidine photolyase
MKKRNLGGGVPMPQQDTTNTKAEVGMMLLKLKESKSKSKKKKSGGSPRGGPLRNLTSPFASLLTRALHRGKTNGKVTEATQPAALDQEPSGPGNAGSSGETGILWFRNDLRLHDHEALSHAMKQCSSILPVFCFDPREYGRAQTAEGSGNNRDRVYFDRAGPYKAGFTQEAVRALQRKLRSLGSDLVIRLGKPEEVIPQLCRTAKATIVYCHGEVSKRDQVVEDTLERNLKANSSSGSGAGLLAAKLKRCWGSSTLHHVRDVPFEFDSMPANYSAFCKQLNQTEIKPLVPQPKKLRPWPVHGRKVKRGRVPTLEQLGIHVPKQRDVFLKTSLDGKRAKGGEDIALSYLRRHSSSLRGRGCPEDVRHGVAQRLPDQLAPWFSLGCISVKKVYHEVLGTQHGRKMGGENALSSVSATAPKKSISAISKKEEKDFIFELLWRDFFRFSRLKMSKTRKNRYGNIATATV